MENDPNRRPPGDRPPAVAGGQEEVDRGTCRCSGGFLSLGRRFTSWEVTGHQGQMPKHWKNSPRAVSRDREGATPGGVEGFGPVPKQRLSLLCNLQG